jgi:hypothetical protein
MRDPLIKTDQDVQECVRWCRRVLREEPHNWFVRSVLAQIEQFPDDYPTANQHLALSDHFMRSVRRHARQPQCC